MSFNFPELLHRRGLGPHNELGLALLLHNVSKGNDKKIVFNAVVETCKDYYY